MTPDPAHTAAEIFRRRVVAVRSLDRGEKLLAGPRLFERACVLASAGLRQRHPAADEATIRSLLQRQFVVLRRPEAAHFQTGGPGRPKDQDDCRGVIALQGNRMDWKSVFRWCDRHGIRGLLDEIRRSIPADLDNPDSQARAEPGSGGKAGGQPASKALREAQLAFIKARRENRNYEAAHPYHWAAYGVTGR